MSSTASRDVTPPAFFGKGKKSACEAWKCYHDVTSAFTSMVLHTFTEVDATTFNCWNASPLSYNYDKTSDVQHVNDARKEIFCQKGKCSCKSQRGCGARYACKRQLEVH